MDPLNVFNVFSSKLVDLVIKNILKLEPNHPEAIFYRGRIAKAEGDYLLADELWTRLLETMGPNAPVRKSIETQINSLKTRK